MVTLLYIGAVGFFAIAATAYMVTAAIIYDMQASHRGAQHA